MKEYGEFHDGLFEGLRIDGETVHVYLKTLENDRIAAVANGVVALDASGFKTGNIVLSVSTRDHDEITLADIQDLYDLRKADAGEEQGTNLLAKARRERLTLLEVVPSYGASCLVLTKSVNFLTEPSKP